MSPDGTKRVVASAGLDMTDEELLAWCGDSEKLIAPHPFPPDVPTDEWCGLCQRDGDDPIHIFHIPSRAGSDTPATETAGETRAVVESPPYRRHVEVALDDHEIAAKARIVAEKRARIAELLFQKKQSDDHYKKEIGGLEEECDALMREIHHGRAELETDVIDRRDFERKVFERVRASTGEVVESRALTPRELQMPLPAV